MTLGIIDYDARSKRGSARDTNQDHFAIGSLSRSIRVDRTSLSIDDHSRVFGPTHGHLLVVADGIGGAPAGREASSVTTDQVVRYFLEDMVWDVEVGEDALEKDLQDACRRCEEHLAQRIKASPEHFGMGTTLTLAYVVWPHAHVLHVGDSRCYLMRDGALEQVTRDHTLGRVLADAGEVAGPARARGQNVLYNAVGGNAAVADPDVHRLKLELGDTLLLCTDGVAAVHSPDTIRAHLQAAENARHAAELLTDAQADDDQTVVVARFLPRTKSKTAQVADESGPDPLVAQRTA